MTGVADNRNRFKTYVYKNLSESSLKLIDLLIFKNFVVQTWKETLS